MQRPGKDRDSENVPPGGRALQRIQQDRKARGLDEVSGPGSNEPASPKNKPGDGDEREKPAKGK